MDKKFAKQSIERLDTSMEVINLLKNSNINTLEELCDERNSDLKQIGLEQSQIKEINIQLQLLGLNLRYS